jgi:threonine/homoserine/homoserine lactone efflux protein
MDWLVAVSLFALVMFITPGPNNLMVTAAAANHGIPATVPHMVGIALGFPAMLLALGVLADAAFSLLPAIRAPLKIVGALFMLYLAWQIATASRRAGGGVGRPLTLIEAALFQWLNPKAWVVALGALTTYATTGGAPLGNTAVMAALFVPIGAVSLGVWALGGVAIGRLLHTPLRTRVFNLTMAALLVVSLVPIFLE